MNLDLYLRFRRLGRLWGYQMIVSFIIIFANLILGLYDLAALAFGCFIIGFIASTYCHITAKKLSDKKQTR